MALLATFALTSCEEKEDKKEKLQKAARGNVHLGGVFRVHTPESIDEVFPLSGTDAYTRDFNYQVFEPLLRTDLLTMRTGPHLVKKWEVNESGTLYRFHLRTDVLFHPDDCFESDEERKLTVDDVKFSLELACSGLPMNKMSYLLINRVRGAKAFHKRTKKELHPAGVEGVQIIDDSTISIQLIEPFAAFEKILGHANICIYAREAYEAYGNALGKHPIGTGPFRVSSIEADKLVMEKNQEYWRKDEWGNKLPYLDGIEFIKSPDKKDELVSFKNAEVDAVLDIPVDQINYVLGTLQEAQEGANVIHKVLSKASMSMMYIGFANESYEFSDPRIRKAFIMAVNRNEVVNSYLGGEGWPANNGFIPPLDFYPNDDVSGLVYDPEYARQLLSEAGFPDGRGFPRLEFYVNAQRNSPNHNMVLGVVDQLRRNLNVHFKIRLCTLKERDEAISRGEAKIWRAGWIADYPDPENFLALFYSRNIGDNNLTINPFRYKNSEFDDILDQAMQERDEKIRNQLYVLCDQMIVNDAAVMPIFTEDYIALLNGRVKNFHPNSMEILDLSSVYIRRLQR